LHCHRCDRVNVFITHESQTKEKSFPPSATVAKAHKWALESFGLKGREHDEVLYLHGDLKTKLPEHAHIGSYVKFPHCELELCLAHKEPQIIEVALCKSSGPSNDVEMRMSCCLQKFSISSESTERFVAITNAR